MSEFDKDGLENEKDDVETVENTETDGVESDNDIKASEDVEKDTGKESEDEEDYESAEELRDEEMESRFKALFELLDNRGYSEFVSAVCELNPVDAADFFSELSVKKIPAVFKLLPKDNAAEIFAELDGDLQKRIVTAMTAREVSAIIEELALDDAADALSEIPANLVTRILRNVSKETRNDINRFLSYSESSAGSVMTAEFISLRAEMTVSGAIEHIRRIGIDKETVYIAYVTDEKRKLLGTVSFKDLLFADSNALIGDIMTEEPIYATTVDDREYVADTVAKYGLLALPIVDKEDRLVGIVTVDDAIDVINEEATEDIEIMAAITPTDKPYLKTGVFETWTKRFPWLLILMLAAVFSSAVITHYENAIGTYAVLTVFFPMLMNTGGNAGSQSSVAIIRAMSLGEITVKNWLRVVWKEFRVSLLCGACLAIVCFVKTMLVDFRLQATTVLENGATQDNLTVAAIVSATAFFAVVVAKVVGTILPMLAKKIKLDPAVMASPFITTIVDTVTLVIYFSIASKVLGL